jgi:hypothetical protein
VRSASAQIRDINMSSAPNPTKSAVRARPFLRDGAAEIAESPRFFNGIFLRLALPLVY